MKTKLAGHLPLQEMVQKTIERARSQMQIKTASEERKEEKVVAKQEEKIASAINPFDPTEIEKLASALEFAADELTKVADKVDNGSESKQGGEQLANNGPVGGTQPYKKDKAKHQIPAPTTKSTKDNPGPANAMSTDDERAPGGNGAKYPVDGPLRKKASAIAAEYVINKLAESTQGGMTLDSKTGEGPKPNMSADGRSMIASNSAPKSATKAQAKSFQKTQLKEVLTEPAQTKSTDSKVHENLRNASKGGVKIAAARAYLQKIAEEGCQCENKGECKNCKLQTTLKAKTEEKTE